MSDVRGFTNYEIDTYPLCISKHFSYSSIIYFSQLESALVEVQLENAAALCRGE